MPTRPGFKRRAFELPDQAYARLRSLARFYRTGHSRVVDYALFRLDAHVHSLTHPRDRRREQERLQVGRLADAGRGGLSRRSGEKGTTSDDGDDDNSSKKETA